MTICKPSGHLTQENCNMPFSHSSLSDKPLWLKLQRKRRFKQPPRNKWRYKMTFLSHGTFPNWWFTTQKVDRKSRVVLVAAGNIYWCRKFWKKLFQYSVCSPFPFKKCHISSELSFFVLLSLCNFSWTEKEAPEADRPVVPAVFTKWVAHACELSVQ